MNNQDFKKLLREQFPFEPTKGQNELLTQLSDFLIKIKTKEIFILKGYAGTGKTTIVKSLVKSLPILYTKTVLLAPTGRAAKVLSNYSDKQAYTIHKKIYYKNILDEGGIVFTLQQNLHTNTIFIVDEASMISNVGGLGKGNVFGFGSLLDDIIDYVFSGFNCKLIFIGDTAQLPPVGLSISPALDEEFLRSRFPFAINSFELTEVVRQSEGSGILTNATIIRNHINNQIKKKPKIETNNFKDIKRINGEELEDALNYAYDKFGTENCIIVCRSNKNTNIYNQQIRTRIRWQENELSAGDYMMVVKNNYFWLPEESKAGFIANGDIIQLTRVGNVQEMYGLRFADVRMKMIDYENEPELETRLLLNTIQSESPALSQEENKKLYQSVLVDYSDLSDRKLRQTKIKRDPFLNALQVKFAYAITCHKAQGGQWSCVFVDQGYLTDEMINVEYLRWLYTAVSRASEMLYLVNFNKEFYK